MEVVTVFSSKTRVQCASSELWLRDNDLELYELLLKNSKCLFELADIEYKYIETIHAILIDDVLHENATSNFITIPGDFRATSYVKKKTRLDTPYVYIIYERHPPTSEHQYLDVVRHVLENGEKRLDRTGTGTLSVFAHNMRFDISKTIPLLTTKRMGWKSVLTELLFFLRGDTNSKHLEESGVNIWNGNTTREFLNARGLYNYVEGDMGPMYFYQVYHYGYPYKGCHYDYTGKGFDQMQHLLEGLRNDPFSRRHILTTYNPSDVSKSVLAPCHGLVIMFYVSFQRELSCNVYIRSSDVGLGLPYNIASYAMLTHIIAKQVDMVPKELIVSTGDTHIYANHVEALRKQIERTPLAQPIFEVSDEVKRKNLRDLSLDDFSIIGYMSHDAIRMSMAV